MGKKIKEKEVNDNSIFIHHFIIDNVGYFLKLILEFNNIIKQRGGIFINYKYTFSDFFLYV